MIDGSLGGNATEVDLVRLADALLLMLDREELAMAYLRGNTNASGVAVDLDTMDAFVMMRFAELLRGKKAVAAADRAINAHKGNGGCGALAEAWGRLEGQVASLEADIHHSHKS